MSAKLQPMAEYIVAVPEDTKPKTHSGLYVPGKPAEKPQVARVVAVGKDVVDIKVGDQVFYKNEYEATGIKLDDGTFLVLYYKNVVATLSAGKGK